MSQNLFGTSPFPGDGTGLSLNMENHDPKHWWGSKGLQLSIQLCNQLVQLLWLMLGQTSILPRTSDRNNLDIGSDYMKSPVKDDENARVEQHLQVPEFVFEERKLNMKNTCLPLVFHSHGEFDTSTLQIIKNEDLKEPRELGSGTFGAAYHGKWR
ncbi:uncharacterized protein LOC120128881 [Hibiscus syriacus]|uniref:uncharacterized protein LOC120128881 n=1 Tax=Hibiscus syriacus TaxID=106335 RepID=UPI00192203DB|nr:uncharacterized protein LOC120128881 [Hibiscus syriacus]